MRAEHLSKPPRVTARIPGWFLITFCMICLLSVQAAHAERPRSECSIGFLSHKSGPSFFDYHYTVLQTEHHGLSVGIGTLIAYTSLSVAWKYYPIPHLADVYSVISLQHGSGMGNAPPKVIPAMSIGVEFKFWENKYINLGLTQWVSSGLARLEDTTMEDYFILPQISWGWRW